MLVQVDPDFEVAPAAAQELQRAGLQSSAVLTRACHADVFVVGAAAVVFAASISRPVPGSPSLPNPAAPRERACYPTRATAPKRVRGDHSRPMVALGARVSDACSGVCLSQHYPIPSYSCLLADRQTDTQALPHLVPGPLGSPIRISRPASVNRKTNVVRSTR